VTKEHVAHRRCFDCCACMWPMCKPFRHTTEYILSGGASAVSPSHHILCLFPLTSHRIHSLKKRYSENTIKMASPSISPMESVTSSSHQSSTSRNTSSASSTHPHLARSSSYSHVFPSHQNLITPQNPIPGTNQRGLSKNTKDLARQLLQQNRTTLSKHEEQPQLFSSGLQWLLDVAIETERATPKPIRQSSRVSPLTEDAVRGLDKHGRHSRITELHGTESVASSNVDRARINAWVSETDAAP
jgi:hypothetical protein